MCMRDGFAVILMRNWFILLLFATCNFDNLSNNTVVLHHSHLKFAFLVTLHRNNCGIP